MLSRETLHQNAIQDFSFHLRFDRADERIKAFLNFRSNMWAAGADYRLHFASEII